MSSSTWTNDVDAHHADHAAMGDQKPLRVPEVYWESIPNTPKTRLYHVLLVYALERDYEQDLNGGVMLWL